MADAGGAAARQEGDDGRSNGGEEAPRKKARVSLQELITELIALGAPITPKATLPDLENLLLRWGLDTRDAFPNDGSWKKNGELCKRELQSAVSVSSAFRHWMKQQTRTQQDVAALEQAALQLEHRRHLEQAAPDEASRRKEAAERGSAEKHSAPPIRSQMYDRLRDQRQRKEVSLCLGTFTAAHTRTPGCRLRRSRRRV